MSNTPAKLDATPAPETRRSTCKKLIQAAALAAVLVPLGSVAVETATINCGFGSGSFGGSGCTGSSPNSSTFDFGPYDVLLQFFGVVGNFDIAITDAVMTAADFAARSAALGTYLPVPMVNPAFNTDPFRDFQISVGGTGSFTGYIVEFNWDFNTDPTFPDFFNGTDGHVRLLQNHSGNGNNFFNIDMCESFGCEYIPPPDIIDPGIRSGDTDFSSMTVAWTPVPEPGTLALLGSGITGLLYSYRRRRQKV